MSERLQDQLEALYGLERRRDKLGLEGTTGLLRALGDPHRCFRAVHVAGTNGKGAVCALIERTLRAAGRRTGLFTSPHLVDFRERIRVSGRWADEARLRERLALLQGLPGSQERTFFEVCTALAFDHFAAEGVEWGVIEVGLGGRLDCTNVITPEVAVITAIGLDHTEILGSEREAIAAEKAGIIKPGVPVVNAAGDPAAMAVIERSAAERGAPLVRMAADAAADDPRAPLRFRDSPWGEIEVPLGLEGAANRRNASAAFAALATLAERGVPIPGAAVREGFGAARWPGRFETCPAEPRLWWDGAHNPDGVRQVVEHWQRLASPVAIVFAVSRDKDAAAMLQLLHGLAPDARLFATCTRNPRSLPAEDLARLGAEAGFTVETVPDVAAATRRALEQERVARPARGTPRRILLTGSLFAVGEAMEALGGAPGEYQ